jgi:hypothetical protein
MRRPHKAVLLAIVGMIFGMGLGLAPGPGPAPMLAAAPGRVRSVPRKKIIGSCPAFRQTRAGNDGLRFELHNTCNFPVACVLTWSVHCRGPAESPGERSGALELAVGARDSVLASGDACGPDGWDIDGIHWSCDKRPETGKAAGGADGEL